MMSGSESGFRIVVVKNKRELQLFQYVRGETELIKVFRIALGFHPRGPKYREGDGATPEGDYFVTHRNSASKYYLSLGISYPNLDDALRGQCSGLINSTEFASIESSFERHEKPPQRTALGGDIFIHGGGTLGDWTQGCIALENSDIKELFDLLPLKTPVTILP